MRLVIAVLPFLLLCAAPRIFAQDLSHSAYRGRELKAVLEELRAEGLPLVYSSELVQEGLRVQAEPTSTDPLTMVRELLAPAGLTVQVSGGSWLVVRQPVIPPPAAGAIVVTAVAFGDRTSIAAGTVDLDGTSAEVPIRDGAARFDGVTAGRHTLIARADGYLPQRVTVNVTTGEVAAVAVALVEAAPKLDELTVTASRYDLQREIQPSTSFFSGEQIERLSGLGDDPLRVAQHVPGVAADEFSARSHVRGGDTDEMAVVLDGMTLLEPYHLRDYESVFSAVDQRIVSGLAIYSGGFPAAYGNALSGVTVIDEIEPTSLKNEVGLSLLYTSALSSGTFRDGRGQWLVSARRGNLDRLLEERLGRPSYRDGFVHVAYTLGAKQQLALSSIGFDDDILLTPSDDAADREIGRSDTDDRQVWLTLDSRWTDALSSRTLLYSTRFAAGRSGSVNDPATLIGSVRDDRRMTADGIKQDWRFAARANQLLTWGFEVQDIHGSYAYSSTAQFFGVLSALASLDAAGTRDFLLEPSGKGLGAYASDRLRIGPRLIADLGLRWDRQTYLRRGDDGQISPRMSLLFRLDGKTDLRFSYGTFFQAQQLLDLQIEDGMLQFAPKQSATQVIAAVERKLSPTLGLRVETFDKRIHDPRPRYENLFDPLVLLPELRPGRVLIAPQRAETRGLEVSLTGHAPIGWWLSYTLARADDIVDGAAVPRSWDQRNALGGGLDASVGPWSVSATASLHSGWPATSLTLQTVSGPTGDQLVPVLGARNAERLGSVARIDFRASRSFPTTRGSVQAFAEVTNLTNRSNPCCVSYEVRPLTDGSFGLNREVQTGLPSILNLGFLWTF
jgi:hypothetical protein